MAPILFALGEFQFLVSHLKNKKDLLSKYYLGVAYFFGRKEEQAEKKLTEVLEMLQETSKEAGSPIKSTNGTEAESISTNHLKSAIFYYLGLISKQHKKEDLQKKYFYRSHEEWPSNFKSYEELLKLRMDSQVGEFKEKSKNIPLLENNFQTHISSKIQTQLKTPFADSLKKDKPKTRFSSKKEQ